jgi:hypothetical protein
VRHRRTSCARQQLAQLVLDIDSKEGALLHVATHMIERNLTEVRSILIGLGDFKAHMTAMGTRNWIPHPRGGDVHDLWRLQGLGYSEYRINIHTNQELFDWRVVDVNLARTPRGALRGALRRAIDVKEFVEARVAQAPT